MASGNAIRGSPVGAGPMGEAERGESAPRLRISFWCSNGHETQPKERRWPAQVPDTWDCPRCGFPAGQDRDNPPGPAAHRAIHKTHLAYVRERRQRRGRRGDPRRSACQTARREVRTYGRPDALRVPGRTICPRCPPVFARLSVPPPTVLDQRTGGGIVTATDAVPTQAATWRGGFGRLWTAAVVSKFGDSLRLAAMPLLATSLTDDPLADRLGHGVRLSALAAVRTARRRGRRPGRPTAGHVGRGPWFAGC